MAMMAIAATGKEEEWVVEADEVEDGTTCALAETVEVAWVAEAREAEVAAGPSKARGRMIWSAFVLHLAAAELRLGAMLVARLRSRPVDCQGLRQGRMSSPGWELRPPRRPARPPASAVSTSRPRASRPIQRSANPEPSPPPPRDRPPQADRPLGQGGLELDWMVIGLREGEGRVVNDAKRLASGGGEGKRAAFGMSLWPALATHSTHSPPKASSTSRARRGGPHEGDCRLSS